jgi:NAD+ kinase
MKTAAIISKPSKPELHQIVPEVLTWFADHDYHVVADEQSAEYARIEDTVPRKQIAEKNPTFALVLGGDGTLLSAARAISPAGIPILAVNLGSLGFLTEVPLIELFQTLELVDSGECPIETRSVLQCRLLREEKCLHTYFALNDVVVNKSAIARLVGFDLFIDDLFVLQYKADGVIVASGWRSSVNARRRCLRGYARVSTLADSSSTRTSRFLRSTNRPEDRRRGIVLDD